MEHRVAAAVGAALADLHTGPVFGLAGSGNFEILATFRARGGRYIGTHHEAGAVMMADGWSQASGTVGVASVHQGPGLTNALTAIVDSAKGRTPLVVIAAAPRTADRSSHQYVDQEAALLALDAGIVVLAPRTVSEVLPALRSAFELALRDRRTVVLSFAIDLLNAPAPAEPTVVASAGIPSADAGGAAGLPLAADDLATVRALIASALRPVVLAGRGAVIASAGPALQRFAELAGAPLVTTAPARGLFSGHPWAAGFAGGFGSSLTTRVLADADLVIAVGTSLDPWTLTGGRVIDPATPIVHIDVNPRATGGVVTGVRADARAAAKALADATAVRVSTWPDGIQAELAEYDRSSEIPAHDEASGLDPRRLMAELDRRLPAARQVVIDSGHFMAFAAMYLEVDAGGDFLFGQAFQSVGLGLARAVGAATARPERITLAVVGDGGFLMGGTDLDTAVRLRLPLLVVVVNDGGFGAEVHDFEPLGMDISIAEYPVADIAAMAAAHGARAGVVRSLAELDAVSAWLDDPVGPYLLDCRVDAAVDAVTVMTPEGREEWTAPLAH